MSFATFLRVGKCATIAALVWRSAVGVADAAPLVFTNEAAFNAALAGAGLAMRQDGFEGLPQGFVGFTLQRDGFELRPDFVSPTGLFVHNDPSRATEGTNVLIATSAFLPVHFAFDAPIRAFAVDLIDTFGFGPATFTVGVNGAPPQPAFALPLGPGLRFLGIFDPNGFTTLALGNHHDIAPDVSAASIRMDRVRFEGGSPGQVPEPATLLLFGATLIGAGFRLRRSPSTSRDEAARSPEPPTRGRFRARRRGVTALLLALFCYAGTTAAAAGPDTPRAPELTGLGTLHHPVTTTVPAAQRFFDQGLRLLYAFNHPESRRAFQEAARLDPRLAMAHWGEALTLAPNLNAPMSPENGRLAYAAVQRAVAAASGASEIERALIEAAATRFAPDGIGNRTALDRAYADAMARVAARFPADPEAQTFYADALMNTMPWDYWAKDGSARPDTAKVIAALESVMRRHAEHPGANHYYIHVLEASNDPDRAVASADRLGALMPAAGHMVHMPSHIYIRVGRYADAAAANERAIAADEDYLAQCQAQGLYPVSYYPHNVHFLWAAATLEGRSEAAIAAARKLAAKVPHHHAGAVAWTADFPVTPMLAYARFGRWQDILTEVSPPVQQPYAIGIWHYARGLAYIASQRLDRADAEASALDSVLEHEAFSTTLKNTPLAINLQIAVRIVRGELAARRGQADAAVTLLREAVELDEALPYTEPSAWHQPPRQVLGAVLLEAGRGVEAEAVYREDLRRFRENGWSLFGLARSLEAQGRLVDAAAVDARFATAWARADIRLTSSRILSAAGPGAGPVGGADQPAHEAAHAKEAGHGSTPRR